jgi:methionine synthase I (cobalamin-dependent)
MAALRELILDGPLLLDGAWGTELQAQGLAPGACPDEWNLTHPEQVASVARNYVQAGSRIILTNTFGANRVVLSRHGLAEKAADINRAGASISCDAATGKAKVFASIGPSGKLLVMGEVSEAELSDAFSEQVQAFAAGGVDGLVLETFTDLEELRIALAAAKKTGLPVVACMVFDSGVAKDKTAMGVALEQAALSLTEAGADAIGANCGRGVAGYIPITRRLRAVTDLPIWVKPNAGLPKLEDGRISYDVTPAQFAAGVMDLLEAGANLVGGCCGTSPKFIEAIAEVIRN